MTMEDKVLQHLDLSYKHLRDVSLSATLLSLPAALVLFAALSLLYAARNALFTRADKNLAPAVWTYVPWLGGAVQYAWHMPWYIQRCMRVYGPNFRLLLGGQRVVFVSDAKSIGAMFRNRDGNLHVGKSTTRVARSLGSIETEDVPRILEHELLPLAVKGNTESALQGMMPPFNAYLQQRLAALTASRTPLSLKNVTSRLVAEAANLSLWGESFPNEALADLATVDEASYQLALQIPFLPSAVTAAQHRLRHSLSNFIAPWRAPPSERRLPPGVSEHGHDVLNMLTTMGLSPGDQAGFLVAYLFGLQTNPMRVAFWLLAHLMCDRDAYVRVQREIDEGVEREFGRGSSGGGGGGREGPESPLPAPTGASTDTDAHADPMTAREAELAALLTAAPRTLNGSSFRLLDSAVKEAARLHSLPSSVREVAAPTEFPARDGSRFWAAPGDLVLANTLGTHWNDEYFEEAGKFKVDRFLKGDGAQYLYIFGRGTHMCPGRFLAYYMMKMLTILCLRYYDLVPVTTDANEPPRLPEDDFHSITITLPKSDIPFTLRPRPL